MKRYSRPSEIKVGVVGYGGAFNMGRSHLKEMAGAGMVPTAVAELDPARLAVASADFPGIQTFATITGLLTGSDVDLLTVITPHNTHAALGLEILNARRHCILEKPMAITTTDCDALIATAEKHQCVVSTYHNRHWDGWMLKALDVVNSGAIGDVVRIDLRMGSHQKPGTWWRSSRSISGGILYDWGVHLLEYALQLIRSDITEVSGYAFEGYWAKQPDHPYPTDANEDEAQLVVRFASGQRVNLQITSIDSTSKRGFVEIVGTRGSHLIEWENYETTEMLASGLRRVTIGKNPPAEGQRFYQNIANHLVSAEPLVITGAWARRPIHILELAARSAREGRALTPKYV